MSELNPNSVPQQAAEAAEQTHSVPVLTLVPEAGEKQILEKAVEALSELNNVTPAAPDGAAAVAQLDSELTDAERRQVDEFSKQIDLTNPDHVMLYGADAQKKISSFADSVLANVKNNDTGDVGDMLSKLIGELKGFEGSTAKPTGLKGLFYNAKNHIATIQAK